MIEFGFTRDVEEVAPIYEVSSFEWNGPLEPQQYIDLEVNRFKLYQQYGFEPIAFYLKDTEADLYVALGIVVHLKGWYKEPGSLVGAENVTFLLLANIFTRKQYRNQGLADKLIRQIFKFVELEKLNNYKIKYPNKSDQEIINLVSKKFIWYFYSGVGEYYSRFGCKSQNVDFYKIPFQVLSNELSQNEIQDLISGQFPNKSIRLLKSDSDDDQNLIKHILQNKELQMISQITFNSQPIEENLVNPDIPKCAIKHDYNFLKIMNIFEQDYFKLTNQPEIAQASKIQGAILTNRSQNKSYYCLWATLISGITFIVGMGELQIEQTQIRKTSFTSLSDLEGYNLQDVELLLKTATYMILKRYNSPQDGAIYVTSTDLPCEIPRELLNEYLLNFGFDQKIETVDSNSLKALPTIRKFASDTSDFDLDWTSIGMYSWN